MPWRPLSYTLIKVSAGMSIRFVADKVGKSARYQGMPTSTRF